VSLGQIILVAIAVAAALSVAVSILPRLLLRADGGGDPAKGLVIFVESIRWLSVKWGRRATAAGLRKAGFAGEFLYWRWHATWRGWLVLPALMDQGMLQREAQNLAEFIACRRREGPGRPVYLVGYSCGAFVALRALELMEDGLSVESAAMLAGAFSPRRDLSVAAAHVKGELVVYSSPADWFILGLGTLIFGAADRRHTFSAGMVGLRRKRSTRSTSPAGDRSVAADQKIVEIRWRPGMILMGHMGGHFSATTPAFIARHIAPAMGIARQS
jgi:hypothetical protein